MIPYQFFIVSTVAVPDDPDAVEHRKPSAAWPTTLPEGETIVRVGQGWRTVWVNSTPFYDRDAAKGRLETYPEPKRWSVWGGKTYRHAALNMARWQLWSKRWLASLQRGERPRPRPVKRDPLGSDEDVLRSSRGRDEVQKLAQVDPEQALALARTIPVPWYRCEALTAAALALPPARRVEVLIEALTAAREQSDQNRIVTAASGPLSALTREPNTEALVAATLAELLAIIRTLEHPFRRADGIEALAYRATAGRLALMAEAADLYLGCRPGWKVDLRLKWLARGLQPLDAAEAIRVARGIANGRIRRQTLRYLGAANSA